MPDCPAELVPDFLDQDGYLVWVDLCEPTHEQLARLEQELALDPLAIEDAVANLERTKAIRYGRYTVLTAYATYLDPVEAPTATSVDVRSRRNPTDDDLPPGSVLRLDRLSMFVLPHGVITIRRTQGFDIQEVIDRTENNADLLKHGAGALVHSLLDVIVDSHFDAVQAPGSVVDVAFAEQPCGGPVGRRGVQALEPGLDDRGSSRRRAASRPGPASG